MEYRGMKEDERLVSVKPGQRQIAYQNMEYFCCFLPLAEQVYGIQH
jgi:hypothetical protein